MQFKTRGGISPQGIPKIYYTAHPKDFSLYFDHISDLLLNHQNCAVFFDSDPDHPEDMENFYSILHDMQLIVIPITSNFLERECLARSGVFAYSKKRHIPVLPVLEESGIETRFNEVCGDLQFLNPYERDLTAIPFEEKLSKYLNSVLIGDELAQKIREAFDAYIFMSYRKKDRKEAQKLMRLIHENPFCRDIAIWYDEYLVPGENFNQAIQKAMQKSDLFALTVTPNLLENPNYVMQHEFPDARELGMKILPVEMRETDQEQLRTDYTGIPDCIRSEDTEALTERLLQSFAHLSGINHNPEHEYFIGLAYLSGIDVEVNHEKAVNLITSAAEQELPEAIEKLVGMYHTGDGVERNYETAIAWQRKLADLRKKQFEQEQSEERGENWRFALWKLGDFIQEIGHIAEAETVHKEMLSVCKQLDHIFNNNQTKRNIGVSYGRLGFIRETLGDLTGAKTLHEKTLTVLEDLSKKTDSIKIKRDLAVCYNNLGIVCRARGDLAGAKAYHEKSLALDENLAEQTNSVELQSNLAFSYNMLGNTCKDQGDLKGAKRYYEKSLVINERLAVQTNSVELQSNLSYSYNKLGGVHEALGNLATAQAFYEKSIAIDERLAVQTDSVKLQRNLAVNYDRLGGVYETLGDMVAAKRFYEKGFAIDKRLAIETDSIESQRDLIASYDNLGYICAVQGDLKGAKNFYDQSLAIAKQLATQTDSIQSQRDLLISYANLGGIYIALGELKTAKALYWKNLEISAKILSREKTVESFDDMASCFYKLAFVMESKTERNQYLLRAEAIWNALTKQCPDVHSYAERLNIVRKALKE